jgi:UDP-N-acetylmuramoyl-tripeptide--D-alanyl-D-alanine ligase
MEAPWGMTMVAARPSWAAAVAYALEVGAKEIVEGLQSFQPVPMRVETHVRADGVILVNDAYNANPSSVRVSVESFAQSYPDRPRWVVLGDMRELGAVSRQEHAELGEWLGHQPLERIFLYGRDSRFTEAAIRAAGFQGNVERFRKKRYLIDALQGSLEAEKAAVLFKASRKLALEQVIRPLL